MIKITISGIQQVETALDKMSKVNTLVTSWMKSGEPDTIVNKSVGKNFDKEGRPSWELLADDTIIDRVNKGFSAGKILSRTGNLKDEVSTIRGDVSSSPTQSTMIWGIDKLRAKEKIKFRAHQLGRGKSGQDLPARPMLGFQKEDGKTLTNSLRNWILKSF